MPVGPVVPTNANIAGGVSGLNDSGLVLQLNGANDLALTNGTSFYTFSTALAAGANYTVTVNKSAGSKSAGSGLAFIHACVFHNLNQQRSSSDQHLVSAIRTG